MNIYAQKQRWKLLLLFVAIGIGIGSLWYTNELVHKLEFEEKKRIEIWSEAQEYVIKTESFENLDLMLKIIQYNVTIPLLIVDGNDNLVTSRNIDSVKIQNPKYFKKKLQKLKEFSEPFEIKISDKESLYLYYSNSIILSKLSYYPLIQLAVILLFIVVSYIAFSYSRKAEQNQVWLGLSKETAHQLGTPISSLLAWLEMMRVNSKDNEMLLELEKDIKRLEKITERFSKIGSKPALHDEDIFSVIEIAVNYLKFRSSDKVNFKFDLPSDKLFLPLNSSLFEWVIENVCKNAVDAINGSGSILIAIKDLTQVVYIDISDNGKGISKRQYKNIFKPGYTTKQRGWGLGLSLAKRIVEDYHNGKIFVLDSDHKKGTTMRIVLKKKL